MLRMLKNKIKQRLISGHRDLFASESVSDEQLRNTVVLILNEIIEHEHISVSDDDKKTIIHEVVNDLFGFGPIEDILKDPLVTEIMINSPKKIYVERLGKKELSSVTFEDDNQLMYLIHRLLGPTRRHVDETYPYTETVLRDGSRMNIIIPPLAWNGPTITIRKFSKEIPTTEH